MIWTAFCAARSEWHSHALRIGLCHSVSVVVNDPENHVERQKNLPVVPETRIALVLVVLPTTSMSERDTPYLEFLAMSCQELGSRTVCGNAVPSAASAREPFGRDGGTNLL